MASPEHPDEDWSQIADPNQRRRIQNRLAQRTWRAKRQRTQVTTEDAADFLPSQGARYGILVTVSAGVQLTTTWRDMLPDALQSDPGESWQSLQFFDPGDQNIVESSYKPIQTYSPATDMSNLWQSNFASEALGVILADPSTHDDNESLDTSLRTQDMFLKSGNTALHEASLHGHCNVVRRLLERGANIDLRNSLGNTALHLAAGNGHQTVVTLLVEQKSGVDLRNQSGQTALHLAAASGQVKIVELLLDHGAKIDLTRD